jgi:hypothetical protein
MQMQLAQHPDQCRTVVLAKSVSMVLPPHCSFSYYSYLKCVACNIIFVRNRLHRIPGQIDIYSDEEITLLPI